MKKIRQLELRLPSTRIRKIPAIKRALVSFRGIDAVYRLGKRIIGEHSKKDLILLSELDEKGQVKNTVASGSLTVFSRPLNTFRKPKKGKIKKILETKSIGMINYQILEEYRTREFLRKGIGKQIIKSIEKKAKEQELGLVFAVVRKENTASLNLFINSGFKKLKGTEIYYKIL